MCVYIINWNYVQQTNNTTVFYISVHCYMNLVFI